MGDLSDLPYDIWVVIAKCISFIPDLQRFASVCVQWREIAMEILSSFPSRHPLLMLPYDGESQTCSLLDISNSIVHTIRLPELHDRWICGASNGWLIMLDNQLKIQIFNPYSRAQLQLPEHPCIVLCSYLNPSTPLLMRCHYMDKVILSGSPASNSECYAAAIVSAWRRLAICRIGSGKWTTIKTELNQYQDVTFYKGKVIAARYSSHPLVVFEVGHPKEIKMIESPRRPYPDPENYRQQYVVESSGDLLLVMRIISVKRKRMPFFRTYKFRVYRLNNNMRGWSIVESLGDYSLFVGRNRSTSINVSGVSGCRANCIYYVDDYIEGMMSNKLGCQVDCGVFSLDDGSINPLPPAAQKFWPSPGFWCMQSL